MEVFWFMKKVFLKKATCFLLILLMAIVSIGSMCFASTYGNISSACCRFVWDEEDPVKFDNSKDEIYVINLYNRLIRLPNKKCYGDGILPSELVELYKYIKGNADEVGPEAVNNLDFLRYLIFINGRGLT